MKANRWITAAAVSGTACLCGSAYSASLEALWQFEETSGILAEDSVDSLDADLANGASLNIAGRFGSGLDLSSDSGGGSNATVNSAAGIAATQQTGDFTVAVWLRPTTDDLNNNFARVIDASTNTGGITSGYRLFTGGTGLENRFRFLADKGASNVDITHTRTMTADTWTLWVVRYDVDGNATTNVLIDGDSVNSAFVTGNNQSVAAGGSVFYASSDETTFGAQDTPNTDNNFDGPIDDAAFFSGLLTDEEVATLYNSGAGVFVPEPTSLALLGLGGLLVARRRRS